jgi:hypothetical protein
MIKNLLKKKIGFISIELVIIAAIVLVSGFVAVGSFVEDGQVASNDAADKIDDTLLLAGDGLPGELPAVPGGDGISCYDNLTLAMEDIGAGTLGANANFDTSGNKSGETVVVLTDNLSATSSATITLAYVRDAVLRHSPKPENSINADYNEGGFYIGGGSDRNGVVIYMDNCEIYGKNNTFVLRGTSGEHDNKLYMSNCRLTGPGNIRIDNNTHELYLGVGNNFDGSDAVNADRSQSMVSQVFHTTETYR